MLNKNSFQNNFKNVTKFSAQLFLPIFIGFSSCNKNMAESMPAANKLSSTPLAKITRLEYYPFRNNWGATIKKRLADKVILTIDHSFRRYNPFYSDAYITSVVYIARADTLGLTQQDPSTEIQVGKDDFFGNSNLLEAALADTPLFDPLHPPDIYGCGKLDAAGASLSPVIQSYQGTMIVLTSDNGEKLAIMPPSCEGRQFSALDPRAPWEYGVPTEKYGLTVSALNIIAAKIDVLLPLF